MKRFAKMSGWFIVTLIFTLLAPSFLSTTPKASAATRSSYILFWIPGDRVSYLKVEGNNQYGSLVTWSRGYSPPTGYAETANGNTKWWWNSTIVLTFTGPNLGTRTCIIDNLNTASNRTIVTYTPGEGCSGETGSARSWRRTVEEMNNYMSENEAYQVADGASYALDVVGCLEGIAKGLASKSPVMTIVACGGAALYRINEVLNRYGTHLEAPSTGDDTNTSGRWSIRIFNVDDSGVAYMNENWDTPLAEAEYGSDTGWVDITTRMTSGENRLVFGNWNNGGGYAWGFQVAYNGNIVWSSQGGQAGVRGANNDDTSRPSQWTCAKWLLLQANGTVTER